MEKRKHKIWLMSQSFLVDDEQLKVINTPGVKEDHAHEFVTTGKKTDYIKKCIEIAESQKQLVAPVADKKIEQMVEAGLEKAIAKLLADYDLTAKKK